MRDLSEAEIGTERIAALVRRDKVAHGLGCKRCDERQETAFWLAVLGWTPQSFLEEAYPELYGGGRG